MDMEQELMKIENETLDADLMAEIDMELGATPSTKEDRRIDPSRSETGKLVLGYLKATGLSANKILNSNRERLKFRASFIDKPRPFRQDMEDIWLPLLAEEERCQMAADVGKYQPCQSESIGAIVSLDKSEEVDKVIRHFIWQVKRKALGLKVENHLVPIFVGNTGSGKTNLIEKLLAVVPDMLTQAFKVSELCDERSIKGRAESLVIFCDEMSGAKKAEIETLKNWITASIMTYRPLRSNETVSVVNQSTVIGAANLSVGDILKDETGMRRFYQIDCDNVSLNIKTGKNTLDWSAVNSYDYKGLWLGVDPYSDSPISDIIYDVTTNCTTQNSIDGWLESVGYGDGSMNPRLTVSELHKEYRSWCFDNGYKDPKGSKQLSKHLVEELGWQRRKSNGAALLEPPE